MPRQTPLPVPESPPLLVICVSDRAQVQGEEEGAARWVKVGAAYRAVEAGEGWLRVWDDRGEDSLYPAHMFAIGR